MIFGFCSFKEEHEQDITGRPPDDLSNITVAEGVKL